MRLKHPTLLLAAVAALAACRGTDGTAPAPSAATASSTSTTSAVTATTATTVSAPPPAAPVSVTPNDPAYPGPATTTTYPPPTTSTVPATTTTSAAPLIPPGGQVSTKLETHAVVDSSTAPRIDLAAAKAAFDSGKAVIVDVRGDDAYANNHIKGAMHLALGDIPTKKDVLPKNKMVIAYCT